MAVLTFRCPSTQAPVHELNRQIQLVNRELNLPPLPGLMASRQQQQDRHDLAHLREELAGCYAHMYPHSIFSTTTKTSVWRTEALLRPWIGGFARHLHSRQKQYVLAPVLWRR